MKAKNQEEELESDDYMNGFYIYKNINNFFYKNRQRKLLYKN